LCERSANGYIALLERQTPLFGKTGRVCLRGIIWWTRTTLESEITKEGGKGLERTVIYDNDKNALRQEFGSDTDLNE